MEILIQIAQLILSLSILVVLHELGHFIPAKLFKTRVEKFYLFFDPWFSVVKKKIGETEYGIGWVPLGGYVKISGMIDESMDTEQMKQPAQPWEFRSKPAWQRLIIMLGGVTVNLILAAFIYAMLLWSHGERSIPMSNAQYGFVADDLAQSIGIKTGDHIIGYDHKHTFDEASAPVVKDLLLDNASTLQIVRDGQAMDIAIPQRVYKELIESEGKKGGFVSLAFPADIDTIYPESPLRSTAALKGDRVVAMNGVPIQFFSEMSTQLRHSIGKQIPMSLVRGADTIAVSILVPATGKLAIGSRDLDKYFEVQHTTYSFLGSFPAGVRSAWHQLRDYVKQFRIMFNPQLKAYKQVGGFARITSLFPTHWDWTAFWMLTAFLSIMLAFINVLPIPALDGGHAMFTIYEMISGRKPTEKFLERAQIVGFVLILSLMIFANGNDLFRWLFHKG
jgi:regulator of sigma E protease